MIFRSGPVVVAVAEPTTMAKLMIPASSTVAFQTGTPNPW